MYYGSNPGCTQARKFHLFFPPACHCESKLYLAIRQVLDSLMTCVRVTHTFALSPDKICLFGLCRNLLTEINSYPFDFKGCYIPSRYSSLGINQQVIYIFNRNLHAFPNGCGIPYESLE